MTENEHVKLGAYHTLELELRRAFTLHKARAGLCRMWPLLRLQLHCTVACSVCSQQHCNESLPSACAATAVCGWPAAWLQPTYLNAHCSTAAGCVGLCCQCPYFLPLFPQDVWDSAANAPTSFRCSRRMYGALLPMPLLPSAVPAGCVGLC